MRNAGILVAISGLFLGSAAATASASTPQVRPEIVGGASITQADAPWQALFIANGTSVCGGSFITPTTILSAAHCFANVPKSAVQGWAGITNMADRSAANALPIASITVHEGYDPTTFANDLAIVTLSRPMAASFGILPIALPASQDASTWPAAGTQATVSGWGETVADSPVASNVLQAATVQVQEGPSAATCGNYGSSYLPSMQICAGQVTGGVDACQGDSGGPLSILVNDSPVLAGVASTGYSCAVAGYPGLYVRMTNYLPWLAGKGIDIARTGAASSVTTVGSSKDGVLAPFRIGGSYVAKAFAAYAKLPGATSVRVTGGKACVQSGAKVKVVAAGKCYLAAKKGTRSVPLVLTVYSG